MKIIGMLIIGVLATGCNAPATDKPVAVASAPKPVDPKLAEHYRLMAEQAKFKKKFLAALPNLQVDRLYYIDPMAGRGTVSADKEIQGYSVVSQAKVSRTQSSSSILQDSLRKIIKSSPDYGAACFDPHHVVTLSDGNEQFDAVVCFDCGNYRIFSPSGDWLLAGSFDVGEESKWDQAFATAGLKREPHDAVH